MPRNVLHLLRIAAPVVHAKQTARCRVTLHNLSLRRALGAQLLQVFCCFNFFGDPLGLCFGQRLEFMLKAAHAGDAGAAVADVVDDFVGSAEDFAWSAVWIGVPGIRLDYPEHWAPP